MPTATPLITTVAQAVTASAQWTDQTPRLKVLVQSARGPVKVVAKGGAVTGCGAIQIGDRLEIEGTWDHAHQRIIASRLVNLGRPAIDFAGVVPDETWELATPAAREAIVQRMREDARDRYQRFAPHQQLQQRHAIGMPATSPKLTAANIARTVPPPLSSPRVLISGSRQWPRAWDAAVEQVLDRLLDRYQERLVVIEGRANGADLAAHNWCLAHQLGPDWHRCHPVDWDAERRRRPANWRQAGHERNTRMLLQEQPELVIAFHHRFDAQHGGTSDMCLKALLVDLPVWLVSGPDPAIGCWLRLDQFPGRQITRARHDLAQWAVTLHGQPLEALVAERGGITVGPIKVPAPSDTQRIISSGEIELPGSP